MPKRVVFREKALQHYIQQREKTVLPVWVTPPTFLILWLLLGLLGLLLLVGLVTQFIGVPVTATGLGIIQASEDQGTAPNALIFLPTSKSQSIPKLQTLVHFQILNHKDVITAHIISIESNNISSSDARAGLLSGGDPCLLSNVGPAIVLKAQLDKPIPLDNINGSCGLAQVQIGTMSLLSSLLGAKS